MPVIYTLPAKIQSVRLRSGAFDRRHFVSKTSLATEIAVIALGQPA